ncbi:MAG: asparagine synthase (glutamine-hydrolyzing) [Gaiellaceae bacterium]
MCGIAAVLSSAPVADDVLTAMRDRLRHRGPDGAATWTAATSCGSVALLHRRLAIIDLTDGGAQPMLSHDGSLAITYNGEIYNYIELRRELEAAGRRFRSESDTEVLLAAYEHWGPTCLDRLNGMFAFAIWDDRRQELFCARDRFGEKPLFHAPVDGGIAIASEMKALFAHPDLTASPSEAIVAEYIAGSYSEEGEETMFAGIRRLPAAHAMTIDAGGRITRTWRYWVPSFLPEERRYEEEAAIERFGELLARSVELRLRADVRVGTSLSGGLDSSMIAAILARLRADRQFRQNTFSSRFDHDPTLSEGPEIDAMIEATGARAYAVTPDPARLAEESTRLHWHQEEPFLSASIYLQWCVMRLAREHATTVLLDGQGADELLGGYQYYFPLHQRDLVDARAVVQALRETLIFTRRLRSAAAAYPDSRRRFNSEVALGPRALARHALARSPVPPGRWTIGLPPAVPTFRFRRQIAQALQYDSLPILLRYADRNAMAFGRETRFPFLDYELVDWATRLPDRALVQDGWQKYLLRRAGEGLLPPRIQWRADKVGYAAPLDLWLRGALKEWARERLFSGPVAELEQYDAAALRSLWDAHQAGRTEHSWALWRWISLNEWLSFFAGGRWERGLEAQQAAATV